MVYDVALECNPNNKLEWLKSDGKFEMKNALFFASLILLMVSFFCCNNKKDEEFLGSYQSVSESEWSITLSLFENNQAEILFESWEPGQYERRVVEKKNACWMKLRNRIVLKYDEKSDTLIYKPDLSFSGLGKSGGSSGFLQSIPDYEGLFNDVPLWKLPHKF
jgi:hypothetical protein